MHCFCCCMLVCTCIDMSVFDIIILSATVFILPPSFVLHVNLYTHRRHAWSISVYDLVGCMSSSSLMHALIIKQCKNYTAQHLPLYSQEKCSTLLYLWFCQHDCLSLSSKSCMASSSLVLWDMLHLHAWLLCTVNLYTAGVLLFMTWLTAWVAVHSCMRS